MQQVIFLLVAGALGLVIFKVRGDAAKQRKTVMARLDAERVERGDYSPTAELFREVGVQPAPTFERLSDLPPVPAAPERVVVDPIDDAVAEVHLPEVDLGPAPTGDPVAHLDAPVPPSVTQADVDPVESDLRALFQGISMPAGLRPLGPLVPVSASFVTAAPAAAVQAGLDAEFHRLDCDTKWLEPTVAEAERNGMRGLITIYPNPLAALDLDGAPLFPGVEQGHVVVRMLAL